MTAGKVLGYPAIRRPVRICDGRHPALCQPPKPTNPYRRGCQVATRCKHPSLPLPRPPIRLNNA